MADDKYTELYRQQRTMQDKYVYFLLAASASAVAFAVSITSGAPLKLSQIPLGLAVLSWAGSFACGIRNLRYGMSILYANMGLIQVERGEHPKAGDHPEIMQVASEGIRSAIENNSGKANSNAKWQLSLFYAGGILFVVWHVIEMYLRTTP